MRQSTRTWAELVVSCTFAGAMSACSADPPGQVAAPVAPQAAVTSPSPAVHQAAKEPPLSAAPPTTPQEQFSVTGVVVVAGRSEAGWALISADGEAWQALPVGATVGRSWVIAAVQGDAVVLLGSKGERRLLQLHERSAQLPPPSPSDHAAPVSAEPLASVQSTEVPSPLAVAIAIREMNLPPSD